MTDSIKPSRPFILGVAGGSGSGKTYFAEALTVALGEGQCAVVLQDNFYIDQSKRFDHDGGSVNFDHPNSIDFDLLASCLAELRARRTTQIPIYDFVTHTRVSHTQAIEPRPLIIVDGILLFHAAAVRELLDERIYFDTPEDVRYERRLERDVRERGRTPEGVATQFSRQVKPMHDQFVQPSALHAHAVVRSIDDYERVLAACIRRFT